MAHDETHPVDYKQYFTTWCWLLVMTLTALAIGYVNMPHVLKAFLLVGTTLAKVLLIGAIFMHLRYERLNLVMLTFTPLLLSIILFFFTFGENPKSNLSHVYIGATQPKIEAIKEK